jgi:hypothetical protein
MTGVRAAVTWGISGVMICSLGVGAKTELTPLAGWEEVSELLLPSERGLRLMI